MKVTRNRKIKRQRRVRAKLVTSGHLRISVYRSSKYLYAQVIDDNVAKTVASITTRTKDAKTKVTKSDAAKRQV
jgi:large subunit ribosomal protein L18